MHDAATRTVEVEGRTYPAGVELLGVDVICGVRVPIIRATEEQIPDFLGEEDTINDGFYCGKTTTIYVRRGQSATVERDTLNHERGHAFLAISGLRNLLSAVVAWPKGYDDFEETLVRIAAPHISTYDTKGVA